MKMLKILHEFFGKWSKDDYLALDWMEPPGSLTTMRKSIWKLRRIE